MNANSEQAPAFTSKTQRVLPGGAETARCIELLAEMPDHPSLISRTHMITGKYQFPQISYTHTPAHAHITRTNRHNEKYKKMYLCPPTQ